MLDKIVSYKKQQLLNYDIPSEIENMKMIIDGLPPTMNLQIYLTNNSEPAIIAEIKKQSPSKGVLNNDLDVSETAKMYETAGAEAISVLTEDKYFGGSLDDLEMARFATSLPILRKDFIIDEYHVWESRAIGADAILLIVNILQRQELSRFYSLAEELKLGVIFEVHTKEELDLALSLNPKMIGINNRDLKTFKTDLKTFESLTKHVPDSTTTICESGISTRADIIQVQDSGADAVLIGESIVTSSDPFSKICELRGE